MNEPEIESPAANFNAHTTTYIYYFYGIFRVYNKPTTVQHAVGTNTAKSHSPLTTLYRDITNTHTRRQRAFISIIISNVRICQMDLDCI